MAKPDKLNRIKWSAAQAYAEPNRLTAKISRKEKLAARSYWRRDFRKAWKAHEAADPEECDRLLAPYGKTLDDLIAWNETRKPENQTPRIGRKGRAKAISEALKADAEGRLKRRDQILGDLMMTLPQIREWKSRRDSRKENAAKKYPNGA